MGGNLYFKARKRDITHNFPFDIGDTDISITIDADSAGVFTSSTNDGGSGTITFSINAGAYAAFSNPMTLVNGDTLAVKRTISTGVGWVRNTGTY